MIILWQGEQFIELIAQTIAKGLVRNHVKHAFELMHQET